jgi:hypothetical protein
MAALAVAPIGLIAFGHGIGWLGCSLVVAMAAATTASLEILGVLQLVLHAIAFLYIAHKGVVPSTWVVATVIGII